MPSARMFAESGQEACVAWPAPDGTRPDAWQSIEPPAAAAWLVDLDVPWWIAGGWAIDLHVGRQTRPHRDIDVGVLRRDVGVILDAFPDWEVFEAERGVLTRLAYGRSPRPTVNSLWCRPQHGSCWKLELLLDDAIDDDWCYRREPSIRRPLPTVVRHDASKLPYLAPEIQLLYKARSLRPRDQQDFEQVLAHIDSRGRAWLLDGLKRTEPGDLSAQRRLTSGSGGDAGHGPSAPFWRLQQPEYDSDYADTYINGALDHPFALPGVKCERCGQTWGGTAIVPYELPPDLQSVQQLRNGWPISGREHAKLRRRVLEALRAAGAPIAELRVGATFQPAYLDVPSRPEADFLWSGLGSVVVSQRVHDTMARAEVSGCEFVRVIPRKIGRRRATRRPPIPSGGEPEDLLAQIAPIRDPSEIPPYYELVVTAQSKHPPGAEPEATCELCGRETYDADARRLVMEPHMWNGQDVFFLATTLWIIVIDRVKALLEPLRPTNVSFGAMASAE